MGREKASADRPLAETFAPNCLYADIPDAPARGERLADVISKADEATAQALLQLPQCGRDGLDAVFAGSSYLHGLALRNPAVLAGTLASPPHARLADLKSTARAVVGEAVDMNTAMEALRHYKNHAALTISLADLGGVFSLAEVTGALTDIADTALCLSVDWLLTRAAGQGKFFPANPAYPSKDSGLIVLAMGKHGAGELNFSSDIDIIVFFETVAERLKEPGEAQVFFVRLTRDLVKMMQERTGDGYVFRTDLRLRPDPGATAVAISVTGALNYYESLGQNWERAAMIKARPCAGDIAAGEAFLNEIRPFVWRKYMDFAAIADTQAMKRQIHRHKGHGSVAVAGHNIKLGRGGIREIEFFAQTQQLIGGGRNPDLRLRGTLQALDALVDADWIEADVRDDLAASYDFLRQIEHCLQMVADEQTHTIPADGEALERFAAFCGNASVPEFEAAVTQVLKTVEGHYANLFESASSLSDGDGSLVFTGGDDDPETVDTLQRMGFGNPPEVTNSIRSWHFGRFPATRSTRSRELLTELTPQLLARVSQTQNPDATFIALDRFIQNLPAGVQIFSLLKANPHLLEMIVDILGSAPRLAETLSRRPHLFDALIDPAFAGKLPDAASYARRLARALSDSEGYEDTLDRVRLFGQEQMALIGARMLTGGVTPETAAEGFTALADALLTRLHAEVKEAFAQNHGWLPGGASAVIALGRLGGREMTASSDLDLILIYDAGENAQQSDGGRPLAPAPYFTRFAQRFIAAVSAPTAVGGLYEVDMRLRPSGRSGMLATRIDAFENYQANEAWTWEHMALTRARVICGDAALTQRIQSCIAGVLTSERDAARVARDVRDMRERVYREKGSTDIWNLKAVRGGLTDVEFIVQYLLLVHAHDRPEILSGNTLAALRALQANAILPAGASETLIEAAALYGRILQVLRVSTDGAFDPLAAPRGLSAMLAAIADEPSFGRLAPRLEKLQGEVDLLLRELVPEPVFRD
ncbi:MAG: bifunctional [glutamine synthetase] adenylyltransferase/[glutamine synthetase]-adenylyl-L-tyrosine phosphorylase [Rhodobiaceae bacterium]|nr:bifunctional [glutamine synthetase] adenylyltransferase/[glutamine synthetase]-adenylyl-L-tyrosine phosphorylase [Rhodobiaceae bacterium]MCC0019147.1 bifunctional [glutamine synthetase] adenylyltransferase/[glutamine synthetase]-adenylyl-L-tyrosine phosphorylase [Rhodobiaceae bacterium]MCC0051059.1 bifunctional [glutamine synthetase] adenylyltransferase/[glutamine synthetase]-adenylyl-L-tyrosine phosphorylase [Rhodobiaceae bacterium]MCC0060094.1 bifunctional [glutamine synthetase] adenylyltra